jgi:hypothetical protein
LSREAAHFLKDALSQMRTVGTDLVSLEWTVDMSQMVAAHQRFLEDRSQADMIIEDMSLNLDFRGVRRIFAIPFCLQGIGNFPATVFTEIG